jgi:mRNA-degrading endonuclease toxin of MazEF toxin-antitoxin module
VALSSAVPDVTCRALSGLVALWRAISRLAGGCVSEREIWWASVGENVGSEINGKSALFSRPVIIYKKLSHGFYFVIPTTTQKKEKNWFVLVRYQRTDMAACLHQSRAIDHRRLSSRLTRRRRF